MPRTLARAPRTLAPAPRTLARAQRLPALAHLFDSFLFCALRIQARDATAFSAGGFIDDGIDERGLARADGFFHGVPQLGRGRGVHAHTTEGFYQLIIACPLDKHCGCNIEA